MSLRKRPNNIQDRFNSVDLGTFNDKPYFTSTPTESPLKHFVPNKTVSQVIEVLSILLLDFQSKGLVVEIQDPDLFRMWFPYTWHLIAKDDEIKNISTGDIYKVEEIISTHSDYQRNYVLLRGAKPPQPWHILRMDDRRNDLVTIIPAFPDTEAKPYEFTDDGHLQTPTTTTWTDVITYTVELEQPGSLEGKMFAGGVQERKPKLREEYEGVRWFGQWIDAKIRLDFWTRSNGDSEKLREWFRDFSNKYQWLIEKNGANRFLWAGSGTTIGATRWRSDIVHRSAFYDIRTEYSYSEDLFKIRTTKLEVYLPGPAGEEVISPYF